MNKSKDNRIFKFIRKWLNKFMLLVNNTKEKVKNAEIFLFKRPMLKKPNNRNPKIFLLNHLLKHLLTDIWVIHSMEVYNRTRSLNHNKKTLSTKDSNIIPIIKCRPLKSSSWTSNIQNHQQFRRRYKSNKERKEYKICSGRIIFLRTN